MTGGRDTCLVIGLGNRFRTDDAAGVVAVQEMRGLDLPPSVEVVAGGIDELGLIEHFGRADRVVVVDAASMGEPPGTIRILRLETDRTDPGTRNVSLHGFGLREVIGLAARLGASPEVTVVAIEPESTAPGEGLSDLVASKIPELVQAALRAAEAEKADPSGALVPGAGS